MWHIPFIIKRKSRCGLITFGTFWFLLFIQVGDTCNFSSFHKIIGSWHFGCCSIINCHHNGLSKIFVSAIHHQGQYFSLFSTSAKGLKSFVWLHSALIGVKLAWTLHQLASNSQRCSSTFVSVEIFTIFSYRCDFWMKKILFWAKSVWSLGEPIGHESSVCNALSSKFQIPIRKPPWPERITRQEFCERQTP